MDIIFYNNDWMLFNSYLAILPVIFSIFLFKMPNRFAKIVVGILWLIYLPNTVYVFTDLHHLIEQWSSLSGVYSVILIGQYFLLELVGLTCFLLAFYPIEILLRQAKLS